MTTPPRLTGEVEQAKFDPAELLKEMRALRQDLNDAKVVIEDKQLRIDRLERLLVQLRAKLNPFYMILQGVFGDLDLADLPEEPISTYMGVSPSPSVEQNLDFWEKWKKKLGGVQAEIIDCLLGHPGMTTTAISVAAHCRVSTASTLLSRLKAQNLVVKEGDKWLLRSL
jgi:hypothetical protein